MAHIITSMPGVVYSYVATTYPHCGMKTLSVVRRGRGTTAHVTMPVADAHALQGILERSYTTLYVAAGTDEQVRIAYAVSQYADRLARELRTLATAQLS